MSDHLEREGPDSIQFHNTLAAALPVIKSKLFMNIDYDELSCYAEFVQYRVQRDLYELCEERSLGDVSWDDFVLLMCGVEELRDISRSVICRRMKNAFFDCEVDPAAPYWLSPAVSAEPPPEPDLHVSAYPAPSAITITVLERV